MDRIIPLRRVIDWLSGFQGIEILIVEQDRHSKISHMNLRANTFFIKSDAPFNKAWSYNVGLKRSTSNIVIFGDADFIMNPSDLIESLKSLDTCDCVIPTNNIIHLNQQESMIDMVQLLKIKRNEYKKSITDGICIFKKESILKISGWNEDIFGFGYDNIFQDIKIKSMLNYKQMEYDGFHLNHKVEQDDDNLNKRNSQIFDYYKDMDLNKINQHINTTFSKIGYLNKFV